jgi:hypothetical protein
MFFGYLGPLLIRDGRGCGGCGRRDSGLSWLSRWVEPGGRARWTSLGSWCGTASRQTGRTRCCRPAALVIPQPSQPIDATVSGGNGYVIELTTTPSGGLLTFPSP